MNARSHTSLDHCYGGRLYCRLSRIQMTRRRRLEDLELRWYEWALLVFACAAFGFMLNFI